MSSKFKLKVQYRSLWGPKDRLVSRLRLVQNQTYWQTWGYSPSKARKEQRLSRGPLWRYRNRQAFRRCLEAMRLDWATRPEYRRSLELA